MISTVTPNPARANATSARERCCTFGEADQLAGIVTTPSASVAGADLRGALVLVSAGLTPKHGPHRLYVELARRLARDGFGTLRFDLGGLGESRTLHAGLSLRERTHAELASAVDWLAREHPTRDLVVGGLCSGAEDAFRYAERDPRVTGVVLVDPFVFRTRGWAVRHVAYRARRRALRAIGLWRPPVRKAPDATAGEGKLVKYEYMAKPEAHRILRALLARGVRVRFVYTGGVLDEFNHEAQLAHMFEGIEFRDLVTLDWLPTLEHTQILEDDRRALVEAIARRFTNAPSPRPTR